MTKKDYIKIADVIKKHRGTEPYLTDNENRLISLATEDIAQDLAVVFASDNDKFDQDKFLEACGL